MNSFRVAVITIGILALSANASYAIFENKELIAVKAEYDKSVKENEMLRQNLKELEGKSKDLEGKSKGLGDMEGKYQALLKENEALKQDRENLMAQARTLLVANGRTKELEEIVSKLKPESVNLATEKNSLRSENEELKNRLQQLSSENVSMLRELRKPRTTSSAEKLEVEAKELKKEIAALKVGHSKLNVRIAKEIKNVEAADAKNSKLEETNTDLRASLARYKKDIADAVKKNKDFEKAMQNMPKKFAETARQNKLLIRETAEMHYNLGVFYIQNKEFERARAEFEKSVEINPNDASARFNLGYIYAEHLVDRKKAILQFKNYLRLSKTDGKDVDWAKKYILTWQTYEGKEPME